MAYFTQTPLELVRANFLAWLLPLTKMFHFFKPHLHIRYFCYSFKFPYLKKEWIPSSFFLCKSYVLFQSLSQHGLKKVNLRNEFIWNPIIFHVKEGIIWTTSTMSAVHKLSQMDEPGSSHTYFNQTGLTVGWFNWLQSVSKPGSGDKPVRTWLLSLHSPAVKVREHYNI